MTQMPQPGYQGFPQQGYQQQYPPQSTSNPLAIVSLICGIIGCLVITPLIGIVTGMLAIGKARPPVGGKGMAIAGIILSILWIVGGGLFYMGASKVMDLGKQQIAKAVQADAMTTINAIHDDGKQAISLIPAARVAALHDELQPLGRCTGVTIPPNFSIIDAAQKGRGGMALDGTATFDKGGTKNISIETTRVDNNNGNVTVDIKDIIIK